VPRGGSGIAVAAGINVHRYTSIYISMNKEEPRLGMRTVELIMSITLTYSQNTIEYT